MARRVVLGRVIGAHGIRGALKVRLFGDDAGNLLRAPQVELAADAQGKGARAFRVASAKPGRPGHVRLHLSGVEDRDSAEAYQGRFVLAQREHLEALGEGEHYWYELIGCRVEGHDGTQVGTLREIWDTGGHDVLVVEGDEGRTYLLPAAAALLCEVNPAAGRIVIEIIPGLLDATL